MWVRPRLSRAPESAVLAVLMRRCGITTAAARPVVQEVVDLSEVPADVTTPVDSDQADRPVYDIIELMAAGVKRV